MSLSEMMKLANNSGLAKNDAQWWPKWMETYARSVHQVDAPRIDISRESLISLLQRLRDSGKSAWVRLQVVRTVEFYQKSVLQSSVPDLSDVRLPEDRWRAVFFGIKQEDRWEFMNAPFGSDRSAGSVPGDVPRHLSGSDCFPRRADVCIRSHLDSIK